ncbi:monomethylamine:corrinoid methyltransferase [Moorella naiadis]|uniref:monomethylamine:corrinoid methyltransferase n=1 Tax=Moorella naiadis (nom. illeg.) TaxID=3093670 RepID=UPI003D9C7C9E
MLFNRNRLPELVERSQTGPYMKESDYDRLIFQTCKDLARKYNIVFSKEVIIPDDDHLADRLWEAGLELFLAAGVYQMDTGRVIKFSPAEVEQAVRCAPKKVVLGMGRDAGIMQARKVEDTERPTITSGPTGTPCSEKYYPAILLSYAREPVVDFLGGGSVATVDGKEVIPGSPLELQAAKRDAIVARDAARRASRPLMHINDAATPLTCAGKMAASDPGTGLRPSDGRLVSQMNELKTNYDQLARVEHLHDYGSYIVNLMCPLIGGIGGGPEGTAILSIATHLLGVVCYDATYHFFSHTHIRYRNNTDRWGLWIQAVVAQALARNAQILAVNDIYCVSGPGTRELFYEVAAGAVVGTVCGMHIQGAGCTGGTLTDHYCGMDSRFMGEAAYAAVGMSRPEANEIILKLLPVYEQTLENPNMGKPFAEVYDPVTVEPRPELVELYEGTKKELRILGLPMF